MAKGAAEGAERKQHAADAKSEVISRYLMLGTAMMRCSEAVTRYAEALNEAADTAEFINLLKEPVSMPMPTGLSKSFPFLGGDSSGKRKSPGDGSDDELDANGKKKRAKKAKKIRDPDAPRRPPSAYIFFQNEVREQVKANNPGVAYSEILQQISEQWKALGEEKQRAFKDRADSAMANFRERNADYAQKGKDALANGSMDGVEAAVVEAALIQPKAKRQKKAITSADAADMPGASAPSSSAAVPAKKDAKAAQGKKESKKDATSAKSKTAATTSTPAVTGASLPEPVVPAKKNAPQTTQETSSDEDSSSDDDSSSDSDDD